MLSSDAAYRLGFECGHMSQSEASAELDKYGTADGRAYDAFWNGYEAFADDADEDEDEDEYYDDDYDGQPDEYTEWQDVYGGDDWDHGQYDGEY